MKKIILATFAALASASAGFAQYSVTAVNTAVVENFTSYAGSALPANWSTLSVTGNTAQNTALNGIAFRGANNGVIAGSGGIYSMGTTQTVVGNTNRMLGVIANGNLPNAFALVSSYTNNTGAAVTQLAIGYSAGQWYTQQARVNFFTVQYSVNGGAWENVSSLNYSAAFNAFNNSNNFGFINATNGTSGTLNSGNFGGAIGLNGFSNSGTFNGNYAVLNSSTFNLASSWNSGDTLRVRWLYDSVGSAGSGARQLLAIDDVSVTAVSAIPEPATFGLFLGGLALGTMALRRRFHRN